MLPEAVSETVPGPSPSPGGGRPPIPLGLWTHPQASASVVTQASPGASFPVSCRASLVGHSRGTRGSP